MRSPTQSPGHQSLLDPSHRRPASLPVTWPWGRRRGRTRSRAPEISAMSAPPRLCPATEPAAPRERSGAEVLERQASSITPVRRHHTWVGRGIRPSVIFIGVMFLWRLLVTNELGECFGLYG
jgi:hypothetical protein